MKLRLPPRPRHEQPVIFDRAYLIAGYMLYVALGASVTLYGSPSLVTTTGHDFTRMLGFVVMVLAALSAVFAISDRWYKFECIVVTIHACLLAPYSVSAVLTSFPEGQVDSTRAAFTILTVIITALLWARGLSLLRRWIYVATQRRQST